MQMLRNWLEKPLGQLLVLVLALVALLTAYDGVQREEKRSRGAEQETAKLKEMAAEYTRLSTAAAGLEKGLVSGEDVIQSAQQLAAENNLNLAGAQTGSSEPQGDFQDRAYTLRFRHAPLKPLPRKVEAFRAHLLEHAPRLLSNA